MKAITVKQPWAYLICAGVKDVENRTWNTKFRGRVYIHAAAKSAKEPYMIFTDEQAEAIEWLINNRNIDINSHIEELKDLKTD